MIKKPKVKKFKVKLHRSLRRKSKQVKELVPDAVAEKAAQLNPLALPDAPSLTENVEPITNETIAEHREEVLSGARKFIYPLQHSKRKLLIISGFIASAAVVAFLVYCVLGLYRFYQYNTFLYRVTQVVPFPVARADGRFISYENYLFEIRPYVHYYQTQLNRDFSGDDHSQLLKQRKVALQMVVDQTYVKILASQNNVSVSNKEINDRLNEVRSQNRLGSNNKVFADVLHDYWGWSISDYKRSLKQQILAEKVVAKLDTATMKRAEAAAAQLDGGVDFATIAKQVSDDPAAKTNGGDYGFSISDSNPNVPPEVVSQLFKLKPGQISGIINTGNTLEIVKLVSKTGDSVVAAHVSFNLKDISTYIKPLEDKHPVHIYVHF